MPVSVVGATSEIVACAVEPPSVAVMVALSFLLKLSAVATNVPLLAFAAIATEAGTDRSDMLETIPTVAPPAPAGPLRFKVHVDVPAGFSVPGLQLNDEIVKTDWTICTVAPAPVVVIPSPPGVAPKALVTEMGADVPLAASVTFTVATTPLAIVLSLSPAATQICPVALFAHVMLLLAAVSAGPATTDTAATPVEYPRLHWIPAGWFPEVDVNVRLKGTVAPGAPLPELNTSEDCASRIPLKSPKLIAQAKNA